MPPKQSLKSMLPKFKYNIPSFMDDYHPMMMEYAASSSDQQQAMAPYQPNKRPQMGRNPKNQFRALAGDLEPHGAPSNDQRFNRRPNSSQNHQTSGRPNYRPSNSYHQAGANDYRANGPQPYGNFHSPASNSVNQQPLTSESRFRENPANFVQRNRPSAQQPGQGFGRERRPAVTRN